jgi:hypothetical membrane protein
MQSDVKQRNYLLVAGLLGGPVFVASLLGFGALHPELKHSTSAVSRLGASGTPWGLWFGFFGFLLPGLMALAAAWEFRRVLAVKTWSSAALIVYGILIALTAVPADFRRMFESPWTWGHAFFVLTSPLVLFAAIPGCARGLRALGVSKVSTGIFVLLGYLPLAELALYGVFVRTPGLVQRGTILTTHLAIAWLSWLVLRRGVRSEELDGYFKTK